jgi:hypothetical protein
MLRGLPAPRPPARKRAIIAPINHRSAKPLLGSRYKPLWPPTTEANHRHRRRRGDHRRGGRPDRWRTRHLGGDPRRAAGRAQRRRGSWHDPLDRPANRPPRDVGFIYAKVRKATGLAEGFSAYDRSYLICRGRVFCRLERLQAASEHHPEAEFKLPCQCHCTSRPFPIWLDARLAKSTQKQGRQIGVPKM